MRVAAGAHPPPPLSPPRPPTPCPPQEAEVDKASFLGAKQKEKEVALEKAQVAEASLEELKEKFRELRRQEEKMIKAVEAAEAEGSGLVDVLKREGAALQARKQAALERRGAAEKDRAALFSEAAGRRAPAARRAREEARGVAGGGALPAAAREDAVMGSCACESSVVLVRVYEKCGKKK